MTIDDWHGQNIPSVHKERDGTTFSILPVMERFLKYDEDTITDLLPSANSYGWGENLVNAMAWANNAYKQIYFIPDFSRYGCLPRWFPTTDMDDHPLTEQGQVDRFLYLLDLAYGGLPDDHRDASDRYVAEALIELAENIGEYVSEEEEQDLERQPREKTEDQ
jgi:hypothetical protein